MEIENKKIGIREKELAERQRHASERQEAMRAKLAASISKNFDATSMGAGMDDEGNKKLQIGLQNVLMDFFNTASGGEEENPNGEEEPKGEQQGQARQISSPSEMADAPVGSWFVKGDKKYIKQENGQFLPEE